MASTPIITTKTVSANAFVGSIGINTSGGYYMDAYKNSSQTISSLKYLGIDTVRDSLSAYGQAKPVLDAMAAAGIKFDFMTPGELVARGSAGLAAYVDVLKAFQAAHPGSIISVEGLNEANIAGAHIGAFTMEAAAAFQKALYTAVKGASGLSDVSVLNLSISHDSLEAYKALGDLGKYSDYANAHAYPHTGSVIDDSMQNSMDLAGGASKGDPIVVTETGYTTYTGAGGIGASETAQAKLILNNLLNAYENGSQQTYIYMLFDVPSAAFRGLKEVEFGVFNADGSPKLAANAIHNFTTILQSGDDGSAAAGTTINYSLSNAPSETHAMAMQKSGGVYDIVVWTDKIVWNETTGKDVVTPTTDVTVNLGKVEALVYVYDPLKGIEPIAVYRNVQSIKIPLSDHALIIEVGAKGPVTEPVTTVAPNLTMTAAELVASIDTLAVSNGLQSITLSDSAVLKVSSLETMKHMVATYGAVLSKVKGDFTFSVSFEQQTWRKVQTFDEAGKLLTRTDYGLSGGKVVSECKVSADGGFEYTAFGVKGKSFTVETQVVNAKGQIVDLIRKHADNTMDSRETLNADGTKKYLYFDAKGVLRDDVTTGTDGSKVSLSYDTATGKLARNIVLDKDGSLTTTTYKAGIKSKVESVTKAGVKEVVTFDTATGKMLTDSIKNVDGSSVIKVYVNGALSAQYDLNRDGSQKNWLYDIKGRNWTSEIQVTDTKGKVIDLIRKHADGTLDSRETLNADGTKKYLYYDAKGVLRDDVTVGANGSNVTLSYDTATGKIARNITLDKDGNLVTTKYIAGIKSTVETTLKSGFRETVTFDTATGKTVTDAIKNVDGSSVLKVFVNGIQSAMYERGPDGSQTNTLSNIAGKSWTTEIQVVNPKGQIVDLIRKHADGTFDSRETLGADGTKKYLYYDAKGVLRDDVTVATDGSRVTLNYDTATKMIAYNFTLDKDGNLTTTGYKAGIKATVDTVLKSGWKETVTFDTKTGKMLTDSVRNVDGSSVVKVYVNGALSAQYEVNRDGSQTNTLSNITGKSWTTEIQVVNAKGQIVDLIRKHADGTFDSRETVNSDGTKDYLYYNAKGVLLNDVTVGTNGSRTTLTYDAATSKLAQSMIENGDGTLEVKKFVNGVLTNQTVKNADGTIDYTSFNKTGLSYTTEHQTIDKGGNILLIERLHADGSYDYKEVRHLDGSKEISSYDAAGQISTRVSLAADASRTVETFLKDGTGNVRTDAYDSAIKLLLADIRHQDGSHALTVYANGQSFHGGAGNDTIQFRDTIKGNFAFDGGRDTLTSFNVTAGSQDQIVLDDHWAASMADLHMSQSGKDTVISFDNGHSITLEGIAVGSVTSGNFLFV
ncbi:hypothetical protein C8J36_102580 [Rhizobium sp. PP-F2F-G48]|uniref:hypothetical protein n=1 Tax=Rhizobium sp. PP-F2F-G48 TaxID=2135651 RepID=UPI0010465861|nr:hypothetical protein [Rhizobium sp. PP-F2F-G48]TCM57777.1 hypothetical protein C8J36_102580 [Rhizobium sp. PP-F2F-G48]